MSDYDYAGQVEDAFPELDEIDSDELREQVIEAWTLALDRGSWRDIEDIPYAWNIHEVSNVEHVRGVTRIAVESAREQRDFHGADPDVDTVVAAALLHDVGKCYEYVDHVNDDLLDDPDETYASEEIPHSLSGYALAHEVGCRSPSSGRSRTSSARFPNAPWRPNSSKAPTPRPRTRSRRPRWASPSTSGSSSIRRLPDTGGCTYVKTRIENPGGKSLSPQIAETGE